MELDPRHGTHDPSTTTVRRRRQSVRRTTSIDMLRPSGVEGPVQLRGAARDLSTGTTGAAMVLGEASLTATVDFHNGRRVQELELWPHHPGAAALVNIAAASGFRSAVDRALPDQREATTLLYQLLDDVPVATLVSGFALQNAGYKQKGVAVPQQKADICSGWRTGGTIMIELTSRGQVPPATGPVAPDIEDVDDPIGWHRMAPLSRGGMRRRRRLDVTLGALLHVDAMLRDSHVDDAGLETVVHEYAVSASVDPDGFVVRAISARPHVLPWMECPSAALSAQRLVGQQVQGLRDQIRTSFLGVETCTHLNDLLRTLTDVPALALLGARSNRLEQ
ncbi:MAG: hypothetical protein QOH79_2159 [Acidimicrobiaceae bacterium]